MNQPVRLLLVEDDPDDVEIFEEALKDHCSDYILDVVNSGDKVITFLESATTLPERIVLDLNLPKMHGKDVLRALKSDVRFMGIPVMILTTSSAQADVDFCLETGAAQFFTKPTSIKDFQEVIRKILC